MQNVHTLKTSYLILKDLKGTVVSATGVLAFVPKIKHEQIEAKQKVKQDGLMPSHYIIRQQQEARKIQMIMCVT